MESNETKEAEVTTTQGNQVSTEVSKGIAGEFSQDDVQRGRIALMQANATLVKNDEQRHGALVDLVSGEELAYKGNKDEPAKDLEFMIFGVMKYWVVKDADTDEFIEKFPAANANELSWEETVNGRNLKRTYHYSYLVLLPGEIAEGFEIPYELAFRSTAVKDTKKLNSIIDRMSRKGVTSNQKVFKATIATREKNGDTWYGIDLGVARDASEQEQKVCTEYFNNFVETKDKFMSEQNDGFESGAQADTSTY